MPGAIGQGLSLHAIDLGAFRRSPSKGLPHGQGRHAKWRAGLLAPVRRVCPPSPWVCRTSGRNAQRSCRTGSREGIRMADILDEWQSFWRSEERREGKEWVGSGKSRWGTEYKTK